MKTEVKQYNTSCSERRRMPANSAAERGGFSDQRSGECQGGKEERERGEEKSEGREAKAKAKSGGHCCCDRRRA